VRGEVLLFAVAVLGLQGADVPEIQRVRVPADKVLTLFPPKAELRSMPRAEFEALVRRAQARAAASPGVGSARILRARHFLEWEAGLLRGRSELTVERPPKQRELLSLEPWTPAVVTSSTPPTVASLEDGRTCVLVDPGSSETVTVAWEQRAREGSNGLSFDLGLPRLDASTMLLDLPAGAAPTGPPGIRQGPAPASDPARRTWRIDGPSGLMTLRIHHTTSAPGAAPAPRVWVGGKTSIDVTEANARWQAQWMVDPGEDGPRRLTVAFDAGLTVHEVLGSGVASYQNEPSGSLTIRLSDAVAGPTSITIRGSAPVPEDGPWNVPAAHPTEGIWTGGQTSVRIGPTRTLELYRERAGRRVAPGPGEVDDEERGGRLLVFDSAVPRSVATLVLKRPSADLSAEVAGQVILGEGRPKLEAFLTWHIHRGRPAAFIAHVPPGWELDRVSIPGHPDATWTSESHTGGGTDVHLPTPSSLESGSTQSALVFAVAANADHSERVRMPRVRPIGSRVVDELWCVKSSPNYEVAPSAERGLAWTDPSALRADTVRQFAEGEGLRDAIAWRWIEDTGQGWIVYRERTTPRMVTAWTTLSIERDRAQLDWYLSLSVTGDSSSGLLPVSFTSALPEQIVWHAIGEESGAEIAFRPATIVELATVGLAADSPGYLLDFSKARGAERLVLHARHERAWNREASLPLIILPESYAWRGNALITCESASQLSLETRATQPLDSSVAKLALSQLTRGDVGERLARFGRGQSTISLAYHRPRASVRVTTESMREIAAHGVIEEAVLCTSAGNGADIAHRLTLCVASSSATTLSIILPPRSSLESATSWGEPISPAAEGNRVVFPLNSATRVGSRHFITLEYSTPSASSTAIGAARPEFSLPCMAFRWEIDAPARSVAAVDGTGLVDADPAMHSEAVDTFGAFRRPRRNADPAESLRALDARVRLPGETEDVSLADMLAHWDAPTLPVVVDRDSVAAAGVGPRSVVRSPRDFSPGSAPSARELLEPMGLTVLPIDGTLLVTSRSDQSYFERYAGPSASRRAARMWTDLLRGAAGRGSDPSDRFQSVARWRQSREYPDPARGALLHRPKRFAAVGWPKGGAAVSLGDSQNASTVAWAAGAALLALGIAVSRLPVRTRSLGLGCVLIVAILVDLGGAHPLQSDFTGLYWGIAVTLTYWLGRAIVADRIMVRTGGPSSSLVRARSGSNAVAGAALALSLVAAISQACARQETRPAPIIVLLPYDRFPDLNDSEGQVVLLLKDYQRLVSLSTPPAARVDSVVSAATVHHRFHVGPAEVALESRFSLHVQGTGRWSWAIPVGDARDLTARLDDKPAAILINEDASAGVIAGEGAGKHDLLVRRVLPRWSSHGAEGFSTPINAVATATIEGDGVPSGAVPTIPLARGSLTQKGADLSALLGASNRLQVRWDTGNSPPSPASLKGLLLWDIEPAGDRIHSRWTVDGNDAVSKLRLALDGGLVVRSATAPGAVDLTWAGTPERPEWIAQVSPPLRPGQTLILELFRPVALAPNPALELLGIDTTTRRFPSIEPLGVTRPEITLAIRRPADWFGTLNAPAGFRPITESEFQRTWPELAESPLHFAGAARGSGVPGGSLATGPEHPERVVRPETRLTIEAGRVAVKIEADVSDRSGRSYTVPVQLPADFHLNRVESEGLTDWSYQTADRLRLRFDGDIAEHRIIHIDGWIPIPLPTDVAAQARRRAIALPTADWPGSLVESDKVIVVASAAREARIIARDGAELKAMGTAAITGSGTVETTYNGPELKSSFRLTWNEEPPRVAVRVESLLTVLPKSAVWHVRARYTVLGGPAERVRLKLPTVWTADLTLQTPGATVEKSEAEGPSTILTIRPDRPIWGSHEFQIVSERDLPIDSALDFPEVLPQGRGTFLTELAIDDASGRSVALEGSAGLQPVEASRFDSRVFPLQSGVRRSAFKVTAARWSLRVRPGIAPPEKPADTKIARAEYKISAASDGSAFGRACFDIRERAGDYLSLRSPAGVNPIAAYVDGSRAQPFEPSAGRLLIPLKSGAATQVVLLWESSAPRDGEAGFAIPAPMSNGVPALLEIFAPSDTRAQVAEASLSVLADALFQANRLEWAGEQILASLERIDRGSTPDRKALMEDLVRFVDLADVVKRSAWLADFDSSAGSKVIAQEARSREQASRLLVAQGLADAGFEELARAARIVTGRNESERSHPIADVTAAESDIAPDPPNIGIASTFMGSLSINQSPRILIVPLIAQKGFVHDLRKASFLSTILASTGGLALFIAGPRRRWVALASLFALAIAAVAMAPVYSPLLLLAAACGWVSARF
jgi:hypothetical protein